MPSSAYPLGGEFRKAVRADVMAQFGKKAAA
jgi:hypothetical protein